MDIIFFLKGILLGFAIAAPVGPIGILCIRRTVQYGRFSGLFSGLGAATADTIYAGIAAFGLNFASSLLIAGQFWLQLLGGLFLLYLGYKTFYAKIQGEERAVSHTTLISDFFSTFLLTLTNPATIFSFVAVFAALGLHTTEEEKIGADALLLVVGVFLGSGAWWLSLSEGITLFRKRFSYKRMLWINRIAGALIAVFGAVALLSALASLVVPLYCFLLKGT